MVEYAVIISIEKNYLSVSIGDEGGVIFTSPRMIALLYFILRRFFGKIKWRPALSECWSILANIGTAGTGNKN